MTTVDPLFVPSIKALSKNETKLEKLAEKKIKAKKNKPLENIKVDCKLIELLAIRKMSLRDLSRETGVNISTLSRLSKLYTVKQVRILNLESLALICDALKCDFNDLLTINRVTDLSKEKELELQVNRAFDLGFAAGVEKAQILFRDRITCQNALRL